MPSLLAPPQRRRFCSEEACHAISLKMSAWPVRKDAQRQKQLQQLFAVVRRRTLPKKIFTEEYAEAPPRPQTPTPRCHSASQKRPLAEPKRRPQPAVFTGWVRLMPIA